ncbi:phytoene/squalene synthase family protein [Ornithinimicrobium pratense]|uniref:Phytoene/squalene synthase family protein n=1 Tax=Ornithinimicrobium pratense TaxID=2593973 RepID=A0A5J6V1E8_9MICO|nr:phytoene/squalene synthase family protein [Ornithinimicrobium pratense]QFG67377.1 phytoene/squalene synthase family protein [Ornithinimicrobium pratense]
MSLTGSGSAGSAHRPSDPLLVKGYQRCAELTRQHGTTYYWGALLLPPEQRVDVYAVYALCRLADDIVDEPEKVDLAVPMHDDPAVRLRLFEQAFTEALAAGGCDEPVMAAVVDSLRRRGTDPACFDRFFRAMELDLTRETWASWEELRAGYMEGSAAVIGEMMLPVLEPHTPLAQGPARSLGLAFQLTNFLRDVGEDLDRGRVYLPQEDLDRHGTDPWERTVTPQWRAMMAEQIERNRALYRDAARGVGMLPKPSARCVATALRMYSLILRRIEEADYDVFSERRRVPRRTKVAILSDVLLRGPSRNLVRR